MCHELLLTLCNSTALDDVSSAVDTDNGHNCKRESRVTHSVLISSLQLVCILLCYQPFVTALLRGIVCNWMVTMAVWIASGCSTVTEKFIALVSFHNASL